MKTLDSASLAVQERTLLERFAARLAERLGEDLDAVWLFGSRARGEPPRSPDSDVDVLVLTAHADWDSKLAVHFDLEAVAAELDLADLTPYFSVHVDTPEWLEGRREIKSFFIAEVDRDKIVVLGSA